MSLLDEIIPEHQLWVPIVMYTTKPLLGVPGTMMEISVCMHDAGFDEATAYTEVSNPVVCIVRRVHALWPDRLPSVP
jgi:hypothetical protein